MIKISELAQQLGDSPQGIGVLVTELDEELPDELHAHLPDELDPYAPLPIPELYLG
jgi:hypothetical protein